LVVIAIIALLAVIVFVALNPALRFAQARNSRRWNDVNSIMTAIHEYAVDHNGAFPAGLQTYEQQLGTCAGSGTDVCTTAGSSDCLNIASIMDVYLKTIPIDPLGSAFTTYYSVAKDSNNIITVKACNAEQSATIQVSR
jgi:type II secretory pathway pseudopilin PulG